MRPLASGILPNLDLSTSNLLNAMISSTSKSSGQSTRNRRLDPQRHFGPTIDDLPAEVLLEIFMTLKESQQLRSWYKINLVCLRWRRIAVGAPLLWTTISTANRDLALLMLARSRSCELHIELHRQMGPIMKAALFAEIERFGALYIYQSPHARKDTDTAIQAVRPGKRALRLRELSILREPPQNTSGFIHTRLLDSPSPFMSLSLMASNLLQVLELQTIECDWSLLPLPNLTRLALRHPIRWASQVLGDQVISTLRRMPALRYLSIDCTALFRDRPNIHHPIPNETADLPQLTHLVLTHASTGEVDFMLRHMAMPRLRDLYLYCDRTQALPGSYDYSSLLSAISATGTLADGDGDFQLDGLSLMIQNTGITLYRGDWLGYAAPVWIRLPYEGSNEIRMTSQVVTRIAQRISKLVVHATPIPEPLLLQLFAALPMLETIFLIGRPLARALIEALNIPTNHFPFPALKEIDFREALLDQPLVQALSNGLKARAAHGAGIQRLHLTRMFSREEKELESLMGLVPGLQVDFG